VDYRRCENALAGVGRLNFPVVNKSQICHCLKKVRKAEIELAASLS